eukprot:3573248-Prymnesium_polylepis.1
MELLGGANSKWHPYIKSLPSAEAAAPPSLWERVCGDAAAAAALHDTSIGPVVEADARCLDALLGGAAGEGGPPQLWDALGGDTDEARAALLRSLGLVLTRMVSGVGLVPFFDCANGTVTGRHNATIERSQLAASAQGEAA